MISEGCLGMGLRKVVDWSGLVCMDLGLLLLFGLLPEKSSGN